MGSMSALFDSNHSHMYASWLCSIFNVLLFFEAGFHCVLRFWQILHINVGPMRQSFLYLVLNARSLEGTQE